MSKIEIKDMMAGKGKTLKAIRKSIEEKNLEVFKEAHFGILPMTKDKLAMICKDKGLAIGKYDLNEGTGLLRNTCMSPRCIYYLQPLTHREMHDHLKLWRG